VTADQWHRRSGPWGQLEFRWIQLETPAEYVSPREWQPGPTKWFFDCPTALEARRRLISWGLPDTLLQLLDRASDEDIWEPAAGGGYLLPPPALVEGMEPDVRRRIYHQLAQLPNNGLHSGPATFCGGDLAEWFDGSHVPAELIDQVRRLTFETDGVHFFSDLELLLGRCPSDEVRQEFVRCIWRHSTVLARLRLDEGTDYDAVVKYWFPFRRPQSVKTLLRGMASARTDSAVDLVHMLSPMARERLYTFPAADDPSAATLNCSWTAANFFNRVPDDRFVDPDTLYESLAQEYYPVASMPAYGDLVAFVSPSSRVRMPHVAVYLAGDLVFTKNGQFARRPWILMPLQQLQAFYGQTVANMQVHMFRRKPFPNADGLSSAPLSSAVRPAR
jgi:hypothetical protein